MKRYLFTRNPHSIVLCTIAILFVGALVGLRFAGTYPNKLIGILFCLFPVYLFIFMLNAPFVNRFAKITVAALFGLLALISLPLSVFNIADTYLTLKNGGVDPAQDKLHTLYLTSSKLVVYRSDAGAPTPFDISVVSEKIIFPGMYIEHQLFDISGADDVTLTVIRPNSVRVDAIDFASPDYRAEYMSGGPEITEGKVIIIN